MSSDSSSGDDDDVTDMEIDNIRNELEQSYQVPESSTQINTTYEMFSSNEQAQKENDSLSNCSSNQYDNRSDSTFATSTVVATTTAATLSPSTAFSTDEFGSRKRAASPTSSGSIEAIDVENVENVEKRKKLTDMLLVANNSISNGEISQI